MGSATNNNNTMMPKIPSVAISVKNFDDPATKLTFHNEFWLKLSALYLVKSYTNVPGPDPKTGLSFTAFWSICKVAAGETKTSPDLLILLICGFTTIKNRETIRKKMGSAIHRTSKIFFRATQKIISKAEAASVVHHKK